MPTGTVKWFNETKGYGFIQPDQGGKDVFVHISAVERSNMRGLAEGMKVSYEAEADRKTGKESATNLKSGLRRMRSRFRRVRTSAGGAMKSTVDAPDWSSIPAPMDDGATRHLAGARVPSVALPATNGETIDLSALRGRTVVYAYPRTGRPGVESPDGWDMPAHGAARRKLVPSVITSLN
jgi:CspA family cold shock protein